MKHFISWANWPTPLRTIKKVSERIIPGFFDLVTDSNPEDYSLPAPSGLDRYLFAPIYYGVGASDPVSDILVFDLQTSLSTPSYFTWNIPASDVPDFKGCVRINQHGDNMFLYYNDGDSSAGSNGKLLKLSNVSIDFALSTVSYGSFEVIQDTGGYYTAEMIVAEDTGYITYRPEMFVYTSEQPITTFNLSGALAATINQPLDGGDFEGQTVEWYGSDYIGSFPSIEAFDFNGSNSMVVHGDYIYVWAGLMAKEPNQIDPNQTRTYYDGVVRLPKSDPTTIDGVVFIPDLSRPEIFTPTGFTVFCNHMYAEGNYLYIAASRNNVSHYAVKVDLTGGEPVLYSPDYNSTIYANFVPGGSTFDRSIVSDVLSWGDKLIITHAARRAAIYLINKSDMTVDAVLNMDDYDPNFATGTNGTNIWMNAAVVVGDYLYFPVQSPPNGAGDFRIFSLDLNNFGVSGVSLVLNNNNLCRQMSSGTYKY